MLPRAPGWPIVGSTAALLRNPLTFLRTSHASLGPVFEVRAVTRRLVVLAGRSANRFIGKEGREVLASDRFWGALTERRGCPHAILAMDGPEHRLQRKHYGDVLSRRIVDEHREGCDALVRDGLGRGRPVVAVRDEVRLLVARLVHHCLARGAAPIDEATARALIEVFRWETNTLLLRKWPHAALWAPRYRRSLARAERFIDELVAAEAGASDRALGGWFERIREGRQQHPHLFREGDVRFALLMPFVAGVDTVGATLGFLLYELHRDASLLAEVRREVAAAYADGVPSAATLAAAPTLHGLMIECLRLYPAAFSMMRRATVDFEHEGHRIPAGTDVAVFTSATHFDPRYFPDPDRLDVKRHTGPRPQYRDKHVFMPYGGGPHVCLGAGMGEALLLLATAAIVRHHPLRLPVGAPPCRMSFDPSLTPDGRFALERTAASPPS